MINIKAKKIFSILLIVLFVFLIGCNDNKHPSQEDENKSIDIDALNKQLNIIDNQNESQEVRLNSLNNFISSFGEVLNHKESIELTDEELSKIFNKRIIVKTKKIDLSEDEINVRTIRYDCLPELCGTLERVWIYVQWWDKNKVESQLLISEGSQLVSDFQLKKVDDQIEMWWIGYHTVYNPKPVFVQVWKLNENKWRKVNRFGVINSDQNWHFDIFENELTIEHVDYKKLRIKFRKDKNMILIHVLNEPQTSIQLDFSKAILELNP